MLGPERLKVAVVEARFDLLWVGQIERGNRTLVVDVPLAVVLKRHAGFKLGGEVCHEFGTSAAEKVM